MKVYAIFPLFFDIQILNLTYCKKISNEGLVHLSSLTNMQNLTLSYCENIGTKGLFHITALTKIQSLNIYNCSGQGKDILPGISFRKIAQ